MALDRISLAHFRNHAATALDGTAKFNLLVGENGAGKTNVLEALSLFAPGRGLRRAQLADIAAASGPGAFAASADLATPSGPVRLGTGTSPERPGRRLVQVSGAEVPAVRLGEWLSIGWLTPAMDRLFMEGAGARRRGGYRLSREAAGAPPRGLARRAPPLDPPPPRHAARLEASLRERNRLLADMAEPDPRWLDAIEVQVAEAGAEVAQGRARLVERLAAVLAALPPSPFARPEIAYVPGGPLEAGSLAQALAEGRRRDRAAQRTLTGPHRDELAVTMAGKGQPAAECSTGEQKAMLIALTLAHAGLLGHERPALLLLDEVAAHLDPIRREALFERLADGPAQVWLTGTEPAPFAPILGAAAAWQVSEGAVARL